MEIYRKGAMATTKQPALMNTNIKLKIPEPIPNWQIESTAASIMRVRLTILESEGCCCRYLEIARQAATFIRADR